MVPTSKNIQNCPLQKSQFINYTVKHSYNGTAMDRNSFCIAGSFQFRTGI